MKEEVEEGQLPLVPPLLQLAEWEEEEEEEEEE